MCSLQESHNVLTICFVNMWENFQPDYNFFTLLLNTALSYRSKPITVRGIGYPTKEKPDLVIIGPYANQTKDIPFPGVPTVFHTAEQVPIPIEHPDIFLNLGFTHPEPAHGGRVIRLPLWMMSIDWFGADNDRLVNPKLMPINSCCSVEKNGERNKFCAFIVSNPMNQIRNNAFHTINAYKPVDSAGRLYNNVGPELFAGAGGGGGERRKLEFLKDYQYVITYENQRAPGYITEKILHAKAAGAVPIYWGAEDIAGDFDERGFINANRLEGDELIQAIKDADWKSMAAVPALSIEKRDQVRRTLSEVASKILGHVLKESTSYIPSMLGQTEDFDLDNIVFATYFSAAFIDSAGLWLDAINNFRQVNSKAQVYMFVAADVSDRFIEKFKKQNVIVLRVPKETPADFPDMWAEEHYVGKIYVNKFLTSMPELEGKIVCLSDAGSIMIRLPTEAIEVAKTKDICLYEDFSQLNKFWCKDSFNKILKTTVEELELPQTLSGLITLKVGPVIRRFYNEAWNLAQQRDVIAGPKWEGMLPNGQPFGHRHDQSIISILGRRYHIGWINYKLGYNHDSAREAHLQGAAYYVHRRRPIENRNFMDIFTDSYVINMERRKDRLTRFRDQSQLMNTVKVWKGIDGRALKLSPAIARLFRPNTFNWKKGVMGCSLSHLGLWNQLLKERNPDAKYLIFEDDARISSDFETQVKAAMQKAPADFDVLYFGGCLPPNKAALQQLKEYVDHGNPWCRVALNKIFGQQQLTRYFHFCAYGYVLSKRGAEKMMKIIAAKDGYYAVSDHMMCNHADIFNIYWLESQPVSCYQEDDPAYMNSQFNNYGRSDSFDSDLWNNNDRFTESECMTALIGNPELNIDAALKDANDPIYRISTIITQDKMSFTGLNHLQNLIDGLLEEGTVSASAPAPVPAPAPVSAATTNLEKLLMTSVTGQVQSELTIPKPAAKQIKLMLVSTHCNQVTGYSKVSYNLINQLSQIPWLKVIHYGFQRLISADSIDGRIYPSNIDVIDAAALEKPIKQGFGYDQLPNEIARVKPDILMIYNDMVVITQFMEAIKRSGIERNFQTWFYVDQVYDCQLNMFIEVINREADRVFAFTQSWKDCLKEQGVHRPIDVMAHGFDSKMFYNIPKTLARKRLNLPDDLFLFVSVNRNQPRKRYDLLIMAFTELIVKYPNKPIALLCVCDKGEKGGWWLFELFARELKLRKVPIERFGNRLMITNRDMSFKDDEINAFYNAADCCVSTADGEGFGLCTFEAMGVGCPQVVPDIGGYREFCNKDNSIIVKPTSRYYLPSLFCPVGGEAHACDPHDICLGMEQYLNDSDLRTRHGSSAAETVKKYTWDAVTKIFVRRLKQQYDDLIDNC